MSTIVREDRTELAEGVHRRSMPRKEDRRLVQGQGVFVDDVKRHGMGFVRFVRSPYAHARIARSTSRRRSSSPASTGR